MSNEHCVIQPTEETRAGFAAYVYAWRKLIEEIRAEGVVKIETILERYKVSPSDDIDDIKRMLIDFPDEESPEIRQEFEDYWFGKDKPGGPKPE